MKIFFLFLCIVGLVAANRLEENENGDMRRWLTGNFYKTMKFVLWAKSHMSEIKAYINEYFDKVTSNIEVWGNKNGLDNIPLGNVSEHFLTAYIDLWNGSLHGMDKINRTDDAIIEYSHKEKTIVVTLPLVLDKIQFLYDFHVVLLLIGPRGRMIGTVDKFKAYMNLTFDFNEYHFKIEKLSTWGMGKVTLHFEGDGLISLVADILSEFVVDVLHPIIEAVINGIINNIATEFVDTLNEAIDNVLHPNSTNSEIEGDGFQKLFQSIASDL